MFTEVHRRGGNLWSDHQCLLLPQKVWHGVAWEHLGDTIGGTERVCCLCLACCCQRGLPDREAKPKEIRDTVPRAWEPTHPQFAQAHREENGGTKTELPPPGSALKDPLKTSDG